MHDIMPFRNKKNHLSFKPLTNDWEYSYLVLRYTIACEENPTWTELRGKHCSKKLRPTAEKYTPSWWDQADSYSAPVRPATKLNFRLYRYEIMQLRIAFYTSHNIQ